MLPASLIVMTFDREQDAEKAYAALDAASGAGQFRINDYAIARKQPDGSVDVRDRVDSGVRYGALFGVAAGLLLGAIFAPLGGLVLGAAGGALIGKWADLGIDERFVNDVTDALKPGGSALFVTIGRDINVAAVTAALEPFEGTLHHTTLPISAVESIERALR